MSVSLIINADDLGYEPEVTRGILESMREGVVSSTTLMVNGPHSAEAAVRAKGHGLAIGLHLNLARWAPLSAVPEGLLDSSGEFHEAGAARLTARVVEAEAHAQLERLQALLGVAATHLDVHKHLHTHPAILEGLARAAKAHRLPVRSISPAMRAQLLRLGVATNDAFLGEAGADAFWSLPQLETSLAALPSTGVVELMCHPGYAPKLLHSGYARQREVELSTFVSPTARALLEKRGLEPTSYRVFRSA